MSRENQLTPWTNNVGLRNVAIDEMFKITLGKKAERGMSILSINVSTSWVSYDCESQYYILSTSDKMSPVLLQRNLARLRDYLA